MKSEELSIISITLFLVLIFVFSSFESSSSHFTGDSVQKERDLQGDLEQKIQEAREKGDYNCCLDPPCTMCYLGSWTFPEGECHCDEAIANDNWDNVCPECKKGMKKGQCESSLDDTCDVNYGDSKEKE